MVAHTSLLEISCHGPYIICFLTKAKGQRMEEELIILTKSSKCLLQRWMDGDFEGLNLAG